MDPFLLFFKKIQKVIEYRAPLAKLVYSVIFEVIFITFHVEYSNFAIKMMYGFCSLSDD